MKTKILVAALLATACSRPTAREESSGLQSFIAKNKRWASVPISVCWESTGQGTTLATKRGWVKDAVTDAYSGTGVSFTGWGSCGASASGIRIGVFEDGATAAPRTLGLGNRLNGVTDGMKLHFEFTGWSSSCERRQQGCIEKIAVHEFGHAIGLAHEHLRNDKPTSCTEPQQGSAGDTKVGSYDSHSVMNYCNTVWNNGGVLSTGDKAGIAELYGDDAPAKSEEALEADEPFVEMMPEAPDDQI